MFLPSSTFVQNQIGMENQHVADMAVETVSVSLVPEDLPGLRRDVPRTEQAHDFHDDIRTVMDILARSASEPTIYADLKRGLDLTDWPNLKKYIARHKHAEILVGPGIVSLTAELIPEVTPPACALLLCQSNGVSMYLLPGSQPDSDTMLAISD